MDEQRLAVLPQQLQDFNDAYHRHDPQAMAALYAPGCRITIPGLEIRGRDQAKRLWAAWFHAFPDAATEILRAPCEPGLFALEWEERATHRGRLRLAGFDLPASGRQLCWRGVSIYALGDEGIEAVTYHFDRLELVLQLMTPRSLVTSAPQAFRLWRDRDARHIDELHATHRQHDDPHAGGRRSEPRSNYASPTGWAAWLPLGFDERQSRRIR